MNITKIHQIEITSRCNLRCKYCVHPHMQREKEHMWHEVFIKSLQVAKQFRQEEINICGIGESTMHPMFIDWVFLARDILGSDIRIVLASNGVGLNESMCKAMADNNIMYYVSLHRPEKAGPAIELAKKHGILTGISADPSVASIDWAGQVNYHVSAPEMGECPWLKEGRVMVCANGDITTCCLDGDGLGVIGTIWDDLSQLQVEPYSLCDKCHHTIPRKQLIELSA